MPRLLIPYPIYRIILEFDGFLFGECSIFRIIRYMSVAAKLIDLEKSTLKAPLPSIAERHQLPVLMGDDKHH